MGSQRGGRYMEFRIRHNRNAKRVVKVWPGDITSGHDSQLLEKVRSKIEVAKVLGGTITLTLGLVITNGSVDKADIKGQVAAIALLLSLALDLAAVDAYDTSLMPSVFWRQWTRPFNATLAIHDEMIRVWKGLFLPATVMLALGLFSLALGVMKPGWVEWAPPDWAMGVGLVAAVALFVWCRRSPPPMLRCNAPKAEQRWVENAQTRAKWESESMPSNRQ